LENAVAQTKAFLIVGTTQGFTALRACISSSVHKGDFQGLSVSSFNGFELNALFLGIPCCRL